MELASRSVLITGAGSGIGRATAIELARAGMHVFLTGRRLAPLGAVVAEIDNLGGSGLRPRARCPRRPDIIEVVRNLTERSAIDVMIANAGIHDAASILDGNPDKWQQVVDTNVMGVINCCHAVLPGMNERGAGHIVIVSSTAGRIANTGEPVYVATKHATIGLAEAIRQSVASRGIRVTLIEPGVVDTEMATNPFAQTLRTSLIPLSPGDVAELSDLHSNNRRTAASMRSCCDPPAKCSDAAAVWRPDAPRGA